MQDILNRDIINEDILWAQETKAVGKENICRQVNKIKHLLLSKGAMEGDIVTISLLGVDVAHLASIIACAELGLILMLLDTPATEESLPYTKVALHGPSDYYIHRGDDSFGAYGGLHGKLMERYGGVSVDLNEIYPDCPDEYKEDIQPYEIGEDAPLLLSSTSGTTKPSRPVYFTHKEVMGISRRNVKIFEFDKYSRVAHSRNLHHASAMLTSLLPSLMVADIHFTFPVGHHQPLEMNEKRKYDFGTIHGGRFTHIMIPNRVALNTFLDFFEKPFHVTLNINMCGFALDQSFADMAEEYNVKFHSHYGSIDTAIPLLINFVDKDSEVKPNTLGVIPDDFYDVKFENSTLSVYHDWWGETRYMEDTLEQVGDEFILQGRKTSHLTAEDLVEKYNLDIDLRVFKHDTKTSMEQLRGHIATVLDIPYEDV